MSETTPEVVGEAPLGPDGCPTGPTTSPDVVITDDPGEALPNEENVPDDGSHEAESTEDDPASDDEVETIDPLADEEPTEANTDPNA